jgi:hypothetical protein
VIGFTVGGAIRVWRYRKEASESSRAARRGIGRAVGAEVEVHGAGPTGSQLAYRRRPRRRLKKQLGSQFRAEHAAHQFDIGKLRDLIDAEFNFIDPKWRRRRDDHGRVVGVTYNLVRTGGLFENSVIGAGDHEGEYLAAMRRAIDEYARQCGAAS